MPRIELSPSFLENRAAAHFSLRRSLLTQSKSAPKAMSEDPWSGGMWEEIEVRDWSGGDDISRYERRK
jgi:hypothetical protein